MDCSNAVSRAARAAAVAFVAAITLLLFLPSPAAANYISNPDFSSGSSGWGANAVTNIGSWSDSAGACAYVSPMSAGNGQIWQYIPAWKLPTTNVSLYYWDARKSWYGQNNRATINIYGLKTATAITGGASPGGASGVDYDVLTGAGNLVMGNGFWWSSEAFKWRIGETISGYAINYATRDKYPHGLLLSVSWSGGGSGGAGFDTFVLNAATPGVSAGDPVVGTSTGTPGRSAASLTMSYSGTGVTTPWWIDPEWAYGYEYEITSGSLGNSFKSVELVPLGDGMYDVDVWNGTEWVEKAADVQAGVVSFASIAPGMAVRKFRVRGIEPGIEIDGHGFPVGLIFNNGGYSHTVTMTAFVPEPAAAGVLILGGLAMGVRRRR